MEKSAFAACIKHEVESVLSRFGSYSFEIRNDVVLVYSCYNVISSNIINSLTASGKLDFLCCACYDSKIYAKFLFNDCEKF